MLGQIYILISILTFMVLLFDKSIGVEFLKSYLFGADYDKRNKYAIYVLYSLMSPITLPKIISIKYKNHELNNFMKYIIGLVAGFLVIWALYAGTTKEVTYYNQSVSLELKLGQKQNERLIIIDKMTKVIHQKLQIAKINDTSYNKVMLACVINGSTSAFMEWNQKQQLNANFNEVSDMYKDVSNSIMPERNALLAIEKEMQDIVYSYATLHREVPSKFYLYFQPATLAYIPISTTANKIVNETGVDNQVDVN